MCIYIYIYVCVYIYIYIYIYIHVSVYVCVYIYIYIYIFTHTYTYVHACIDLYLSLSLSLYIYIYICIHICVGIVHVSSPVSASTASPTCRCLWKKNTPSEKKAFWRIGSRSTESGAWAVSAAGLQGKGLHARSCFSQKPVQDSALPVRLQVGTCSSCCLGR